MPTGGVNCTRLALDQRLAPADRIVDLPFLQRADQLVEHLLTANRSDLDQDVSRRLDLARCQRLWNFPVTTTTPRAGALAQLAAFPRRRRGLWWWWVTTRVSGG
jgi:hypothetical protein